jgi:hypothetical protein
LPDEIDLPSGNIVRNDQVIPGIGGRLHVVADRAGATSTARRRSRIRIGQGQLLIRLPLQTKLNFSKLMHLLPEPDQFIQQALRCRFSLDRMYPVRRVQSVQISLDAFIDLLHSLFKLVRGEVLVPVVDGLELAAVNGNDGLGEQTELMAHD